MSLDPIMIKAKKKKVRSLSLLASELLGYSKLAAKELQDQCDDTLLGAHLEDSRWQDMKLGELDAYLKAMKGN
jgi:hypothetical protein